MQQHIKWEMTLSFIWYITVDRFSMVVGSIVVVGVTNVETLLFQKLSNLWK
jgi:hypothetical protein